MARRGRRGGAASAAPTVKTDRQTRSSKKKEKMNGIIAEEVVDDGSSLSGSDPHDPNNCISDADKVEEPIVRHKKFGKIRVEEQNNSLDALETSGGSNAVVKEDAVTEPIEIKAEDSEGKVDTLPPPNRFTEDPAIMDIMRGIVNVSGGSNHNSFSDFRKQSSVYQVENDIPLDGSVIIKPGIFSSNTITSTSNVKSNAFFDASSAPDLSSVNFLKVLQGIEMLERNVPHTDDFNPTEIKPEELPVNETPEFAENKEIRTEIEENKDLITTAEPVPVAPAELVPVAPAEPVPLDHLKIDADEDSETTSRFEEDLKLDDTSVKPMDISSPEDNTSSDIPNDTEDAINKMQEITLEETREASGSPVLKPIDEAEKKSAAARNRTNSTDTTSSESSSNCGTGIRRSNRIRSIGIMKQKERSQATISTARSPVQSGSPAATASAPGYDDKPVKVKSRWRRSSELEMHGGKPGDGEMMPMIYQSSVNFPQLGNIFPPTPEDLERLEKERKDVEDGLKTFTSLTENEYRMERNPCKETRRMTCDCVLTKEEIDRGDIGCGEDCLNRMLFLECGPRCALGERCTNKRFQKLEYAKCKIVKTEKKGFGLRAEEDLPGNTFIMEYVGEVVDQKEFARRVKMYAKENNKHFYFMALKGDSIIDATNKGNISRFINHSCDPNAETQKWTINGELRVGFFTKRFVPAGEEITFDYQFQRYGKEAQKCFCEAATCRGWIGENPEERVEEDEDEDDEDDEEEEEDDEADEDESVEKAEADKSIVKDEKAKMKKDLLKPPELSKATSHEGEVKIRKRRKSEKKKERTKTIVDDMGLEEEIQKLFRTGLKNRAHTLTLSRLMVRAEDWSTKWKLLQLIQEGETPCRRLFLDYHGLRLICSWMVSSELEESPDRDKRKSEILKTLAKLPIPNKNMLLDSKVLSVVEQWSKSSFLVRKPSVDEESGGSDEIRKPKQEEMIPGLGGEIENGLETDSQLNGLNLQNEESEESSRNVKILAESVLESWSSLKEVFRIPKKERIEQMKEHERQADRGNSEIQDNKENNKYDRYGRTERYRNERDRDRDRQTLKDRVRERDRKRSRDSPPDPEWFRNYYDDRSIKMSKQERRKLFALKVRQEDEEAKKRSEHLELWKQHESRCLALGLDPNLSAARDPQTGFPIFFDHNLGLWQNCPPSSGPPHPLPPSPMGPSMYPPMGPLPPGPPMGHLPPMAHPAGLQMRHPAPPIGPPMLHPNGPPLGPMGHPPNAPPIGHPNNLSMGHPRPPMGPPMRPIGPMIQNPVCSNIPPVCSNVNPIAPGAPIVHAGMIPSPHNIPMPNGPVPNASQSQPYHGIPSQGYQPPMPPVTYEHPTPVYQEPTPPERMTVSYEEPTSCTKEPVLTPIPLNAPIKLPPKWKSAKDSQGRVYYYHIKDRVSQWEPPQWTEEEARAEAAKTVAAEMDDDSSSSTESSSETSSDEEEDEEDDDLDEETEDNPTTERSATNQTVSNEAEAKRELNSAVEVPMDDVEEKELEEGEIEEEKSPLEDSKIHFFEDEKDEDLSAWEDEDDFVKPKMAQEPNAEPQSSSSTASTPQPPKGRRIGLVQEIIISPRREEDRVDNRKYKEVKEMLRRRKEEARADEKRKEKLKIKTEKLSARSSSRNKKRRKEKTGRSGRTKSEKPTSAAADTSTDRKIKENFKNNMAGAIVSHLNPYRKQDCKVGRITCNEDFKHLARKLTHFVMLKELKHCRGVDDLECNESVKAKAKDFIRKYMAKFGAVYQRPQNENWKA